MGIGLCTGNGWYTVSSIIGIALVYQKYITKEEAYLKSKFGKKYTDYCKKVNRFGVF